MKINDKIQRSSCHFILKKPSLVLFIFLSVNWIYAGPKIGFNPSVVDAGTSVEGSNETLSSQFTFRNSGTSALQIHKIIPACGCTRIIRYDSLVMPGKSGKIITELDLKGFQPGPLSKVITVISNAEDDSIYRVAVNALVRGTIEFSEPYLSLNSADSAQKSLYVFSKRDNLKIQGMLFKKDSSSNAQNSTAWKDDVPLVIQYRWMPTDSIRNDGYNVYRLTVFLPKISESMLGFFRIQTNHPAKSELFLRGTLLK